MESFQYRAGELFVEEVRAADLAEREGTPLYVYSAGAAAGAFSGLKTALAGFDALLCYSLKANDNLGLARLLARQGAGFDVVSLGEMHRLVRAGIGLGRAVFAGVGKTVEEIRYALENGLFLFNVESEPELRAISDAALALGKTAGVALRVNPGVDPDTHHYITTGKKGNKFGIEIAQAERIAARSRDFPGVEIKGIHAHIGSQILSPDPYRETLDRVLPLAKAWRARGLPVEYLNAGGGFGIVYDAEAPEGPAAFARALAPAREAGFKLVLEPGRYVVGNAGILLSRVIYVKESGEKKFLIVDAAMNDLIRPSLYGAYHRILPVRLAGAQGGPGEVAARLAALGPTEAFDVVGPVCESGDFLAKDRALPAALARGDRIAVFGAGAYGYSMSSNYNSRPRAAEVLVEGSSFRLTRRRETMDDLFGRDVG